MNYLIQGASVVSDIGVFEADVLLRDGFIFKIARGQTRERLRIDSGSARIIDASGKYLIPGIIDEHVHFREPGLTQKADIFSESRAAVAGGVTSFMDMPNTLPQTTSRQALEEKFSLASQKSLANYSFYIGATDDNLQEIRKIDPRKVCGIKLFMGSSTGNMLVNSNTALERLFHEAPCLIAAHCEDEDVIKYNTEALKLKVDANETVPDASVHPMIRTAEACLRSSRRAMELAEKAGTRLHILHISTASELSMLRDDIPLEQKQITAETCPHYLWFDDRDYESSGFLIKCNPAIKSSSDRIALRDAVHSGLIDTIGTDHAPHLKEEKLTGSYFTSKSGFPSVQHGFELMYSIPGFTIAEIVRLMCHNPATLYGIDRRGFIREGYHADVVIVDPDCQDSIKDSSEHSKCGWSPYDGFSVKSRITHTFVNGNLIYENGVINEDFRGERLEFNR